MGCGLRISAEINDWLTDLSSAQPATAAEVGAALAAVMDSPDQVGPPLLTDLSAPEIVDESDLRTAVDVAYDDILSSLQLLRSQAAETGSWWKHTSRGRISTQGSEPLPWTEEEIAELRQRAAELTVRAQRCQRDADAFRARKEALKALFTTASAARDIQLAAVAATENANDPDTDELAEAQAELARAERELATVTADLTDFLDEAGQLRQQILSDAADEPPRISDVTAGLMELRGDPHGADIRLLCAVEPLGTLTLLAVLEGEAAVNEHRPNAIGLAGELLDEIRADGWPAEIGEVSYADTATFLSTFFPDGVRRIMDRSARLAAAATLQNLRHRRGLNLADVARATGMMEHDLWNLETEELESGRLRDVAAYVRALGGRLELTAHLDEGGPVTLS